MGPACSIGGGRKIVLSRKCHTYVYCPTQEATSSSLPGQSWPQHIKWQVNGCAQLHRHCAHLPRWWEAPERAALWEAAWSFLTICISMKRCSALHVSWQHRAACTLHTHTHAARCVMAVNELLHVCCLLLQQTGDFVL